MVNQSNDQITLRRRFLEPANTAHRQYEALRAFLVEGASSQEAARRFGYSPGSFRILVHRFRNDAARPFFLPDRSPGPVRPEHSRQRVIDLRKQNLSIYDISRALAQEDLTLTAAAVANLLRAEGFARLPRRRDDERPADARPVRAAVADARQLDLSPRSFRTRFGGLFLFLATWPAAV